MYTVGMRLQTWRDHRCGWKIAYSCSYFPSLRTENNIYVLVVHICQEIIQSVHDRVDGGRFHNMWWKSVPVVKNSLWKEVSTHIETSFHKEFLTTLDYNAACQNRGQLKNAKVWKMTTHNMQNTAVSRVMVRAISHCSPMTVSLLFKADFIYTAIFARSLVYSQTR